LLASPSNELLGYNNSVRHGGRKEASASADSIIVAQDFPEGMASPQSWAGMAFYITARTREVRRRVGEQICRINKD